MSNRDKIIAAAREAGFPVSQTHFPDDVETIERFYAIAFEAGRQAEREKQIQEVSNAKNKTN